MYVHFITPTVHITEVLIKAFESVLTDEVFQLPTAPAISARKSAQCVLTWSRNNHDKMSMFASQLITTLKFCLSTEHKKVKVLKEKMWERYYQHRCTTNFTDKWTDFLKLSGAESTQTFYQHITDLVFNHLIKEHFPTPSVPAQATTSTPTLDYNERNALRYVSGYITRRLYHKLQNSKHHLKDELCLCIAELNDVDPEEMSEDSEEWMNAIDRGGLKHVTTSHHVARVQRITNQRQDYPQ